MTKPLLDETGHPLDFLDSEISDSTPPHVLRSAKHLYGMKLGTNEGPIGHVEDFYFDDKHWTVRYVVADTGDWLAGRLVLLSPHAFGSIDQNGGSMIVNLKRKQIENSPAIETHKPVSRKFEEGYHGYYGFPPYWEGNGMWGMVGFPMAPPPHLVPIREESQAAVPVIETEPHLRSTKAITGYHIQTLEGEIGHVIDFTIEDKSWAIRHLVIETGHWYSGKEIAISPEDVDRISYEESKVFVNISRNDIQDAQEYHAPQVNTAW